MLVEAAARQWNVDPATLRTESGQVIDDAHGGRKLAYGVLAPAAAKLPAPQDVKLKDDKDLKLIGKSVKRLDTPDKVNGKAQYGIDVRMQDLKIAAFAASPVVGGKVAHVDDGRFKAMPGLQLVVLDDIVAVVGPHFWAAKKGLDALAISWDGGANAKIDSAKMWQELRDTSTKAGVVAKEDGDAPKTLSQAQDGRIDVAYELPFLSHAPMEPQNFTVHVKDGGCEMWGGSQVQTAAVAAAAKTLNTTPDKINFHNYMLGGGFGRRLDTDMVVEVGAHRAKGGRSGESDLDPRRRHAAGHVPSRLSQCDVRQPEGRQDRRPGRIASPAAPCRCACRASRSRAGSIAARWKAPSRIIMAPPISVSNSSRPSRAR